uniref:Uncharacterized protein n=1 Tax=Arundo donax TaxID=35708 RepID=A0A0A9F7W5_ARUDO
MDDSVQIRVGSDVPPSRRAMPLCGRSEASCLCSSTEIRPKRIQRTTKNDEEVKEEGESYHRRPCRRG